MNTIDLYGTLPLPVAPAPSAPPLEKGWLENETCRFCDEAVNAQDFIQPCRCDRRCHRQCLDHERSLGENNMNQCRKCHSFYEFEPEEDDGQWNPMCQFRCLVARNAFLALLASQVIILLLGFVLLPALDPKGERMHWFSPGIAPEAANYLSGLLIFLASAGIVGLFAFCLWISEEKPNRRFSSSSTTTICIFPSSSSSGGGRGSCEGKNDDNKPNGLDACLLILVMMGILFLAFMVVTWMFRVCHEHYKISERYHLSKRHRVKDLGDLEMGQMKMN